MIVGVRADRNGAALKMHQPLRIMMTMAMALRQCVIRTSKGWCGLVAVVGPLVMMALPFHSVRY